MIVAASGKRAQVGGDAAHAVNQVINGAEVVGRNGQVAALQKTHGIAGQGAQGRQGLVQFMGNAGGHLPDGRQFSGLDQFVLGTAQGFFGLAPLANLAFEAFVTGAQVGCALSDFAFQLAIGLL